MKDINGRPLLKMALVILTLYMTDLSNCSKVDHKASFIPVETGDFCPSFDKRYKDIAFVKKLAHLANNLQMIDEFPRKMLSHKRKIKSLIRKSQKKGMMALVQKDSDD